MNSRRVCSVLLVAVLVTSTFAGVVPGTAAADVTADNRTANETRDTITSVPATVYLGEEGINITQVSASELGEGSVSSSTTVTFASEDNVASDNAGDVDFTEANGFDEGAYDTDDDDKAEFFVQSPKITDTTLYLGSGSAAIANDVNVTNGVVPTGQNVTVATEFNFDDADSVNVTVYDSDGLDITDEVNATPVIKASGGYVVLEMHDQDAGQYTVEVEDANDEDELTVSQSVNVALVDPDPTIQAAQSEVTRGDDVRVNVVSAPGDVVHVRIPADAIDGAGNTDTVAENTFDATGDVENRFGTATYETAKSTDVEYDGVVAAVSVGDDGKAAVRFSTENMEADQTVEVGLVAGVRSGNVEAKLNADANDETEVGIVEQSVTAELSRSEVPINDEFTITGSAPEADTVRAYALAGDEWVPLTNEAGYASDNVKADGTYEIEATADGPLRLPGDYRIAVVADPTQEQMDGQPVNADTKLTRSFVADQPSTTDVRITTTENAIRPQLSAATIASGTEDTLELTGTASGQSEITYFVIGPRGTLLSDQIDVEENGEFSEEFDATLFQNRGEYVLFLVGPGDDGQYATDPATVGKRDATQEQNVAIVNDSYTTAGSDDPMIQTAVVAEDPRVEVADFTTDGEVAATDELTVDGTTNREAGTTVAVELIGQSGQALQSEFVTVDSNGTWTATFDGAALSTGSTYSVYAEVGDAADNREFTVVESMTTPTETPATPSTPTPTDVHTTTATEFPGTPTTTMPDTSSPDPSETTSTSAPGFGMGLALIALAAAALIAIRRR